MVQPHGLLAMPACSGRVAIAMGLGLASCMSDPKLASPDRPLAASGTAPVDSLALPNPPVFPSDLDEDGIPDDVDPCPREPENYQGVDDEDGCPDHPGPGKLDCDVLRRISLPDIHFRPDDPRFDFADRAGLDELIGIMRNVPELVVVVAGHSDSHEDFGQELSELRAQSIREYMIDEGVSADQIGVEGFADRFPVDAGRRAKARASNRRVDVHSLVHPDCPDLAAAGTREGP